MIAHIFYIFIVVAALLLIGALVDHFIDGIPRAVRTLYILLVAAVALYLVFGLFPARAADMPVKCDRFIIKDAKSGRIVSNEFAFRNQSTTYRLCIRDRAPRRPRA
jgi:hypothetical protein